MWWTALARAREQQAAEVDKVLAEIGAERDPADPGLEQDRSVRAWRRASERDEYGRIRRVFLSARTGAGLAELRGAIAEAAAARQSRATLLPN